MGWLGWMCGGRELSTVMGAVMQSTSTVCSHLAFAMPPAWLMQGKIESIAKNIYGAGSVEYSAAAEASLEQYTRQGFAELPVCMAKTQYSFS